MAKYKIDLSSSGGTITAATYDESCISDISITDSGSDPYPIVSSTAATGGNVIITYNENTDSNPREWNYNLFYKANEDNCEHVLHLYQEGNGGGGGAGTYSYFIHVIAPIELTNAFNVYLCDRDNPSTEVSARLLSDGASIGTVGQVDDLEVCKFKVNDTCSLVELKETSNKTNKILDSGIVQTSFAKNISYYVYGVDANDSTKFKIFGQIARLEESTDIKCQNYTQIIQ